MGEARRRARAGTTRHDALPAEFVGRLVEMANENDAIMDGTMRPVMEMIAANDVVWGVWQDSTEPEGVALLIIKGANRLREIVATAASQDIRTTAIKCGGYEQAEALRRHAGTDRTH